MIKPARISYITGLLLIAFSIISCAEDRDDRQNCLSYETAYVTAADGPSSAQVGQEVEVLLEFTVFNGCGKFHKFLETESGTVRTIEIEAKYEGCICTQNIPIINVRYYFAPQTPGQYTLKFLSGEEEYKEIVILVEESES